MDIAEIRKKAKAQSGPGDEVIEPVKQQDCVQKHDPEPVERSSQVASTATARKSLVVPEDNVVATQRANEVIDRLFYATDDFVLETEASYADILDDQAGSDTQSSRQYLVFHLGIEEYALDITRISEIIKVREFTDIPGTPQFILGIISLRGIVVPVFDLRRRLNLGESELTPNSRIVVCQLDDMTVGLLVDRIGQVVNLSDDDVEPPPAVLSGLDREMVTGIGRSQGHMIILLNLHSALNIELN
jgi:purine-binding chemotaxis protein CheW